MAVLVDAAHHVGEQAPTEHVVLPFAVQNGKLVELGGGRGPLRERYRLAVAQRSIS